jgi:hypothetical protein
LAAELTTRFTGRLKYIIGLWELRIMAAKTNAHATLGIERLVEARMTVPKVKKAPIGSATKKEGAWARVERDEARTLRHDLKRLSAAIVTNRTRRPRSARTGLRSCPVPWRWTAKRKTTSTSDTWRMANTIDTTVRIDVGVAADTGVRFCPDFVPVCSAA